MVELNKTLPNSGGTSRQVVSAHVGVHLREDEKALSLILRGSTALSDKHAIL